MAGSSKSMVVSDGQESPQRSPWIASAFGGSKVVVGPRIAKIPEHLRDESDSDESAATILSKQIESEKDNTIQYRTCSWQKTAALLFSEYIVLSIMSFPWSYSYLGLVPGLILTAAVAALVLYTSLILWEFCLRHPEVRDICDIGQMLFWGHEWAWWWTAFMFVMNNTFIAALHVFVGAQYLNTMTTADEIPCPTVLFAAATTLLCWLGSLPRTFDMMSKLGTGSALFTFVSVFLATGFAGAQGRPAGYDPEGLGKPIVSIWTPESTTLVTGFAAFMNMSYTFIGQLTLPSFIAEMKDPRDFPKALWACTVAEIITFSIVGGVIYGFTGNQYMVTPAFGTLNEVYKKVSYSFMIPTIIFVGCLYASVTGRFIFFRAFKDTKHLKEHTVFGWVSWGGILLLSWILSFIIAEVIPFFSSLLSVMSSLFNCWFGFIFWALAYYRMRRVDMKAGRTRPAYLDYPSLALNAIIMLTGVLYLTVGTYVSVQGIIDAFEAGTVPGVFSCASNAI